MRESFIGEICLFAFGRAPRGWLVCDGRELNIDGDYQSLFMLITTTYGGDGMRSFRLPDLRGRVPLHQGQGVSQSLRRLGSVGGVETVALQTAHTPAHSHALTVSFDPANQASPKDSLLAASANGDNLYATAESTKSLTLYATKTMTSVAGSGKAHENMMPTIPLTYCICVNGIFPSRA